MADSLKLGERYIADLTGLKVLGTYMIGNGKCTFRSSNASAGYAVTSGKTLEIYAVQIHAAVAAGATVHLLYSDNDVGMNSTTAFTNPVYQFGDAAFAVFRQPGIGATGDEPGMPTTFATYFTVPAGKYPGALHEGGSNSVHITIYGKEV